MAVFKPKRKANEVVSRKSMRLDSRSGSLSEGAYERLKNAIVNFELRPGDPISQSLLEQKYGFGKASIRSALVKLEQEQLVHAFPRQGYIITPITLSEIENVFDLRLLLEPHAVRLATPKLDNDQIVALNKLCKVKYLVNDKDSVLAFLLANREFHLIISNSSGNEILAAFCERLHDQSLRMLHLGITLENQSTSWQTGHEEIMAALIARDSDKAAEVLHREIADSKKLVLKAVLKSPALAQVNLVPK